MELNVPPSSSALERVLGCNSFSLKALIYMREGTMIDMYCSEQVIFVPIHDTMTDAINVPVDFAILSI